MNILPTTRKSVAVCDRRKPGEIRGRKRSPAAARGSVLIVVMWIAFGLVSVALYFAHSMEMELRAADSQVASLQADQAIEGGALYASNILANLGNPNMLPSTNNYLVAAVKVGEGMFWFIGRDTNDTEVSHRSPDPSFGLVDEASKANLNAAVYNNYTNLLIDLPQMTANLDAAMYDWRTSSTTPSTGGAKSETYSTLNPPYLCKLANYETIGELSMVYGMNIDLLYGEDANMNGALDPNENDGAKLPPNDNQDGNLDPGILEYVTVYTHEPANFGTTNRVLVTSTSSLQSFLSSNFSSSQASTYMRPFTGPGGTAPTSVLDFYNRSGMTESDFITIEPMLIGPNTVGLINVNTATATSLACIPGIGYTYAPAVLSYRQANAGRMNSMAWLRDALTSYGNTAITTAGPWVTSRSFQFTADIAAVGAHGRGYRRVRFVFDCSSGVPQIVYRQDLTYLGWALGRNIHDKLLAGNLK
jgi:type II secretory pathway component PulK